MHDAARLSVDILSEEFKSQHITIVGPHRMRFRDLLAMIREIVGEDVTVELTQQRSDGVHASQLAHYTVTPYNFRPKLGKNLRDHYHVDMGEGLLDCLDRMYQESIASSVEDTTS